MKDVSVSFGGEVFLYSQFSGSFDDLAISNVICNLIIFSFVKYCFTCFKFYIFQSAKITYFIHVIWSEENEEHWYEKQSIQTHCKVWSKLEPKFAHKTGYS